MTDALGRVKPTIKSAADDAREALEELANKPISISLEDWSRLSSRILAGLSEPDELRQAKAEAWNEGFLALSFGTVTIGDNPYRNNTNEGSE